MEKVRVCIMGAGNISNTRHIPALLNNKEVEIVGVISDELKKIKRTLANHKFLKKENTFLVSSSQDIFMQLKKCQWFMENVDAVVIGTPPKQHFLATKACLNLKMKKKKKCLFV